MSLRRRIILLFGLLAIVPMLALAAFSYWHARNLLRELVREQLGETAASVADGMSHRGSSIQSSLERLVRTKGALLDTPSPVDWAAETRTDTVLAPAVYLAVGEEGKSLRILAGSIPERSIRCADGLTSRLVTLSSPDLQGTFGGRLEAGFWLSDLVEQRNATEGPDLLVADAEDGTVLFGGECDAMGVGDREEGRVALLPELDSAGTRGTFHFSVSGDAREAAYAQVEGYGWSVVTTTSLTDALSSLRSLTFLYWIIVCLLGISTSLAFSMLIGRFVRSLSELSRAAEEIGLGELDPWLPVPTSGEVGQLTTAFSRMLERIRQMMAQMNQSGRLAVVGQLSAYLAHEIRNPLSSIKLNLQRLLRWTEVGQLPDYCLGPLRISLKEVERLNASMTGVLQLSRSYESPPEALELHGLLEEAADLVASRFRRQGVELRLDLDAEADLVMARPGQLKSVALNLMVNALEAQPDGGSLVIRTALVRDPDAEGPAVSIHFQDAGPGIPPGIRDRIFEPFFTTKAGGAGIGLAMAKQSVEESGGSLHLAPSFDRDSGAEFVLVFPLASRQGLSGKAPSSSWAGSSPSRGSLLPKGGRDLVNSDRSPSRLLTPSGLRTVMPQGGSGSGEES